MWLKSDLIFTNNNLFNPLFQRSCFVKKHGAECYRCFRNSGPNFRLAILTQSCVACYPHWHRTNTWNYLKLLFKFRQNITNSFVKKIGGRVIVDGSKERVDSKNVGQWKNVLFEILKWRKGQDDMIERNWILTANHPDFKYELGQKEVANEKERRATHKPDDLFIAKTFFRLVLNHYSKTAFIHWNREFYTVWFQWCTD